MNCEPLTIGIKRAQRDAFAQLMRPWHRDVFRSNSGDFAVSEWFTREALVEVKARICARSDKGRKKKKETRNVGNENYFLAAAITASPRLATHTWFQGSINKSRKYSTSPLIGVRKILSRHITVIFPGLINRRGTWKTCFLTGFPI